MDPANFKLLPQLLAKERMASYLEATDGRTDRALRLYTWTVEVSAAFWGPIHLLEIGLRNSIDTQMRYHYETEWWLRETRFRFHQNMQSQVEEAEANATKVARRKGTVRSLTSPTLGESCMTNSTCYVYCGIASLIMSRSFGAI